MFHIVKWRGFQNEFKANFFFVTDSYERNIG